MMADETPQTVPPPLPDAAENTTGLPVFRTWPAVYAFVLSAFIVYVVVLYLLTGTYR